MRHVGLPWRALILILATAGVTLAADPRPAPLARYFPRKDLVAYVEFDGVDAHADAWKKTAMSRMLTETPTGGMLAKVATQILEAILTDAALTDKDQSPTAQDVAEIASLLFRSGFAFAINRKADDPAAKPSCIGLVIRGGGRGPLLPSLKNVLTRLGVLAEGMPPLDKPGGRKLTLIGPESGPCVAWWVEKDDLAVAILKADYADAMIAALDGREPNAVDHPWRRELIAKNDDFQPVGLAFLDATALPEMPPEAAMFGLDGIKRLDLQWGYQGEALMTVSRVLAPSPRRGVLAMFDQPTFDARSLPPLPDGVGTFTVLSLDLARVFDHLAALARLAEPKGPDRFAQAADSFQKATGRRLREDILARVGPRMVVADVPVPVFATANKLDGYIRGLARVPRVSVLVEIADRARFLQDLETVATWANAQFPIPKDPKAKPDQPAPLLVRRLKNIADGFEVALSPTYWPLSAGFRPSLIVGERYVAFGTSPDVARKALGKGGNAAAPLSRGLENLPNNLTFLSVADTRDSALPEFLANIPSVIQWFAFLVQGASSTVTSVSIDRTGPPPPDVTGPAVRFRLRLDPDEIPAPEEIRPYLFPASYSMAVDAQGFRIVAREPFPSWNPIALAPLAISVALPAFQQFRAETEKTRLSASLRQVGTAINGYHERNDHYPPAAIVSKEVQPLLSWRVELLPYMGLGELYEEFHRDEPWDSPHNKTLIARMPPAFAHPDIQPPEPGMTFYRGLMGKDAFFDPAIKEGVTLATITDGTTNTMAIVEAREAVPWTKPGTEIAVDPTTPSPTPVPWLPSLGRPGKKGFQALMVDGSVRVIPETINPVILRAIVTKNGGEVISSDSF